MKKNILTIAFSVLAVITATASVPASEQEPVSFQRSNQTLISFELTSRRNINSRIEIYDASGRIVLNRSIYSGTINIPTADLQSGAYNYAIVNGSNTTKGAFLVK
ncbi:T9SS type A sorting domain-containing protein [Chitinophagaceae bacterium MMS25-I14]